MANILANLFGTYSPTTYNIVQEFSDGTTVTTSVIPSGLAGVDVPYLCGVALFGLTLYCLLRIIGAVINNI